MKIKTSELVGRPLDFAVATCEGFVWAKSVTKRQGGDKDWPVNHRYFIGPQFAKNLHPTEKNWNGWVKADMTEPVAPAALVGVPCYSIYWREAGPILEREEISIQHTIPAMPDAIWQARPSMSAKGAGGRWGVGPTPLIAAMRCFVASKLGDEVEVPEGLA